MILCAGQGTRLRPLTLELPKPLVPVGDQSLLADIFQQLRRAGGVPRAVNAHHLSHKILEYVRQNEPEVAVFHEPTLLGTAGGLASAKASFGDGPIIVWNGDIQAQPNLVQLVDCLACAPVALAVVLRPRGEGTCGLDLSGNVVRLRGQSFGAEASGADYMGILSLRPEALGELPSRGCLVGDYLLPLLARGGRVSAAPQATGFSDLGTLGSYLEANLNWLEACRRKRPLVPPLVEGSYISPTAKRAPDVRCLQCIIGENAVVEGSGSLERVVVWPGAVARAPLRDCIVTREAGVVPVWAACD